MHTLLEKIGGLFKNNKYRILLADVFMLAFGLVMIIFPAQSQNVICMILGGVLCLLGVFRILVYAVSERTKVFLSFALVTGAALLGVGIWILLKPEELAALLGTLLALVLIVTGVMKIQYAFDFLRLEAPYWWVQIIGAAVLIGLGIMGLVNVFKVMETLILFLGICFVVGAVWDLATILWLTGVDKATRLAKEREEAYAAAEAQAVDAEPVQPEEDSYY